MHTKKSATQGLDEIKRLRAALVMAMERFFSLGMDQWSEDCEHAAHAKSMREIFGDGECGSFPVPTEYVTWANDEEGYSK
jgi:hypothetical protein